MSMTALAYNEPYKFSSVLLTLAMHAIFFTVLYLGVSWQVKQPEGMEVELWGELPGTTVPQAPPAPPAEPPSSKPAPAKTKQVEQPAPPAKADISMAEKKQKTVDRKSKEAARPVPIRKHTKADAKSTAEDMQAAEKAADVTASQEQAALNEKAALAAKARAAVTSEVGKYKNLISAKIRSKIVMPPDVPDNALAIFEITLLPDGSVLDTKLVKPSGNAAYDEEVERAILKAQPLPLPGNDAARELFINPNHPRLKFSPRNDGE